MKTKKVDIENLNKQITDCGKKIQDANLKRAKILGEQLVIRNTMSKKFGIKSIKEAEILLNKKQKALLSKTKTVEKLKEKMDELIKRVGNG